MSQKKTLRLCALTLAAAALLGASACGNGDSYLITEDDMPYGATMAVNKEDYVLPVQYDYRFVNEELLNIVLRYYYAIQKNDAELFAEIQHPLYMDYQLKEVMGDKYSNEEILENTHEALTEYNEGDFVFSFIDITDCVKGEDHTTSATLIEILDQLSEDADGSKISKDITQFCELTITRYLADAGSGTKGETNIVLYDETLFAFECADEWYIIYN